MKALVMGAAGKTGGAVGEQAANEGHEVTTLVHRDNDHNIPGVTVRAGDARDAETEEAAVAGQDAVIDTIGGETVLITGGPIGALIAHHVSGRQLSLAPNG